MTERVAQDWPPSSQLSGAQKPCVMDRPLLTLVPHDRGIVTRASATSIDY